MKNLIATVDMPHKISVNPGEIPTPGADEVLARTHCFGLCGSDQHLYEGTYGGPHQYPVIPGHEWSGEIIAVGENVTDYKVGDRVTAEAAMWCGKCKFCDHDKNICLHIDKRGLTVDGYARDYVTIKARHLYALPETVDFQLGCMSEPFAVGFHAIRKGMGDNPAEFADKKVLIVGAGPIGLSVAMLLIAEFGFTKVYVSDVEQSRLDKAAEFGAIPIKLDMVDTKTIIQYDEMYGLDGYDFAFESTGISKVLNNIFAYINPLGTIVCLAPIGNIQLEGGLLVLKSIRLLGSIGGGGDFMGVLNAFAKKPDYYKQVITHKFPLEQLEHGILTQKNDQTRIKIIMEMEA